MNSEQIAEFINDLLTEQTLSKYSIEHSSGFDIPEIKNTLGPVDFFDSEISNCDEGNVTTRISISFLNYPDCPIQIYTYSNSWNEYFDENIEFFPAKFEMVKKATRK